MERTALAAARIHTAPRPARKSEWLRSALAHHHCPDEGVDNEIVVLATGIDQYLQEVFHHLAFPRQEDSVSAEDFAALCAVLGLRGTEDATRTLKDEEFRDVCAALPEQIPFKEFHSRLCGFFRARSSAHSAWRLPVSEDTELVERQIRLRWPRYRRRKCVSFDLTTRDQRGAVNRSTKHRTHEQVHEAGTAQLPEPTILEEGEGRFSHYLKQVKNSSNKLKHRLQNIFCYIKNVFIKHQQ